MESCSPSLIPLMTRLEQHYLWFMCLEHLKEAIQEAAPNGSDVVLVDTAGRMQDNEPLMRALSKLIYLNNPDLVLFVGEEKPIMNVEIGSKPPRCERRCGSCGHCEAIQVSTNSQIKSGTKRSSSMSGVDYARGDGSSSRELETNLLQCLD
ncbi:hypothetical protein U1Q18_035726 [Sarracenia purpurea var. burkii]